MMRSVTHYDTEDQLRKALLTAGRSMSAAAAAAANVTDDTEVHSDLSCCQENDLENDYFHDDDDDDDDGLTAEVAASQNEPLDWVLVNYDPETTEHQSVKEELHRLQVLKSYSILDSDPCEDFDRLTRLAARYFHTSVAMISLMDLGRAWFLSAVGCGTAREEPRKDSFCSHAILSKHNLLVIPDASLDSRFQSHPGVAGPPFLKFYAGVPLVAPEGYKIGTFCIADTKPRPGGLSEEDKDMLRDWAALAIRQIVKRKSNMVWNQQHQSSCSQQMIAYTSHDLMTPLTGVQLSLSILRDCENIKSRCTPHQQLLLRQAADCSDFMVRIGQAAMCTLGNGNGEEPRTFLKQGQTKMTSLVENLVMVMEPNPKRVPLVITLHDSVPEYVACDDLVLLRSAINLISNGLRRTTMGCVHLRISAKQNKRIHRASSYTCGEAAAAEGSTPSSLPGSEGFVGEHFESCAALAGGATQRTPSPLPGPEPIVGEPSESCAASAVATEFSPNHPLYDLFFECTDTGPDIPTKDYAHLFHAPPPASPEGKTTAGGCSRDGGLGLLSVATLIHSLDGDFGFRPSRPREFHKNGTKVSSWPAQKEEGSTFWFRVPALAGLSEPFFYDEDCGSTEENPWQFIPEAPRDCTTTAAHHQQRPDDHHPVALLATPASGDRKHSKEGPLYSALATDAVLEAQYMKSELPMEVSVGTSTNQGTSAAFSFSYDSKLPASNGKRPFASVTSGSLPTAIYATALGPNLHNKRPKLHEQQDTTSNAPVCLLATDTPTQYSNEALTRLEQCGWKVVVVHEGQDALRLLKMRHWNVVLFDDDISGTTTDGSNKENSWCHGLVQEFRTWEQRNRSGYRRQNNLYIVCTRQHAIPSALDPRSVVLPPTGFNGVLGKPVQWKELKHFLMGKEEIIQPQQQEQQSVSAC